MSPLGGDFPRERFLRTPNSVLRKVLTVISDEEQRGANIHSRSAAHLAHLVMAIAHGFSKSGGGSLKVDATSFLPFPDWKPRSEESQGPDEGTKFVLAQLIQRRHIPLHIFTALVSSSSR